MTSYLDDLTTERAALMAKVSTVGKALASSDTEKLQQVAELQYGRKLPLTMIRSRVEFLLNQDQRRLVELDGTIKRFEELKRPPPPRDEIAAAVNALRRRTHTWPTHGELEQEMGRALPAGVLGFVNDATTGNHWTN